MLAAIEEDKTRLCNHLMEHPNIAVRATGDLSLFEFIDFFWDEISDDEFKPNWHIEYLCQYLEDIAKRVAEKQPKKHDLIINIPPGTTKTITVSIMFPVWCWTRWYWMRFITGSYSGTLSLESAEKSRDLVRSDKFNMLYPELGIVQDKDVKSNFRVYKRVQKYPGHVPRQLSGGGRVSTSVGGTITGFHAHIIIVDDPLNPKQAASETELRNANNWIDHTISTRKTDKAVTPTILIMQRLHQDDPTGHILAKKKANTLHIALPGEINNYKEQLKPQDVADKYVNGLLDPVRLSSEVLEEMEADLGQYAYAGQVGQNPTPPGGGMFKVDRINYLDHLSSDTNIVKTIRYWDKAASADAGCYTAGVKMSVIKNGMFVIHDVRRGQWSSEVRERIIRRTAETDGGNVIVMIEQEPGSGGKESAESTIRNLVGFSCYADRPTGDKVFRADPFSVQINNGNVAIINGEWVRYFIDELELFPNGKYKDQVDAASGAFNALNKNNQVRVLRSGRR